MTESAERIKQELAHLPPQDRAELAHFLIESLDAEVDEDAEAAWEAELLRRAKAIDSGRAVGLPADQVFAELRKKYS
jgi:putative addiction module component (TIGR02574 family)